MVNQKRFSDIDALRFFAAASVMLMHYLLRGFALNDNYSPVFYGDVALFTRYNYLAVNLFFIISGFVILMSAWHGNAKQFIQSRFLRLYPAFWICCTISFVLTTLFINHIFGLTFLRYIANMTMLNGFLNVGYIDGVYWTLLVEIKFYILIFFILFFNKIKSIENFSLVWLALSALQILLKNDLLERYLITNYAPFFIAGCLFYLSSNYGYSKKRILSILATIPIGFYYESQHLINQRNHFKIDYSDMTLFLIITALYLLMYFATKRTEQSNAYNKVVRMLGQTSYPLYLIHLNVGLVLFNLIGNKVNKWTLLLAVSALIITIAYLISKYLEAPLSRALKKIIVQDDQIN